MSGDEGGACDSVDPSTLTPCCQGGDAYCQPSDIVSADLAERLYSCDDGGVCVPAQYLGGGYEPVSCSSLGGAAGACVSMCVKSVAELAGILPQDTCADDELCAPCIDPTNGESSGACEPIHCDEPGGGGGDVGPSDEPAAEVDLCLDPPSILDVTTLPECCPGARCVPSGLVPPSQAGLLDTCGNDGFCVPEKLVATGGFYAPPVCTSVGGAEGRCMSTCVPAVAEKANDLPQDICPAGELCTPCCDPFTGEATGACGATSCDPGPAQQCNGVPLFPPCCPDLSGHCIAPSSVPADKHDNLETCDNGFLCVPDEMQDLSWKGKPCSGNMLFSGWYTGVCLPSCLKLPFEFGLDKSGCPGGYVCAPCKDPLFGGSTGAPGC